MQFSRVRDGLSGCARLLARPALATALVAGTANRRSERLRGCARDPAEVFHGQSSSLQERAHLAVRAVRPFSAGCAGAPDASPSVRPRGADGPTVLVDAPATPDASAVSRPVINSAIVDRNTAPTSSGGLGFAFGMGLLAFGVVATSARGARRRSKRGSVGRGPAGSRTVGVGAPRECAIPA